MAPRILSTSHSPIPTLVWIPFDGVWTCILMHTPYEQTCSFFNTRATFINLKQPFDASFKVAILFIREIARSLHSILLVLIPYARSRSIRYWWGTDKMLIGCSASGDAILQKRLVCFTHGAALALLPYERLSLWYVVFSAWIPYLRTKIAQSGESAVTLRPPLYSRCG